MNFKTATSVLIACCRLDDVANALACSYSSVAQARLGARNPGYRSPPVGWETALAKLARRRAKQLERLADRLTDADEEKDARQAR